MIPAAVMRTIKEAEGDGVVEVVDGLLVVEVLDESVVVVVPCWISFVEDGEEAAVPPVLDVRGVAGLRSR